MEYYKIHLSGIFKKGTIGHEMVYLGKSYTKPLNQILFEAEDTQNELDRITKRQFSRSYRDSHKGFMNFNSRRTKSIGDI